MKNIQTVLITGASNGIGYELSKLFARDGYAMVLVSRDEEKLNNVSRELAGLGSPNVNVIAVDLSEPDAALEVFERTQELSLEIDVLVNDAGVGERGLFHEVSWERNLHIVQLNIISLMQLTHLYLPHMIARRQGRILQLGSIASYQPTPLLSVYAASKAFVLSFSDALIRELRDTGVTLSVLIPGATDTDFFNKANAADSKAATSNPDDPAEVARAGYDALLAGKHHVTPNLAVQSLVALSNILPHEAVARLGEQFMEKSEK